jgi:hypothetical protein
LSVHSWHFGKGQFAIQWLISLGFAAFVICSDFADPGFSGHPEGVISLTSPDNAQPIFYVSIFTLLLVLATAICDWQITRLNRLNRALRSILEGDSNERANRPN